MEAKIGSRMNHALLSGTGSTAKPKTIQAPPSAAWAQTIEHAGTVLHATKRTLCAHTVENKTHAHK